MPTKLFNPSDHMRLTTQAWSSDLALKGANAIFDFLCAGLTQNELWPPHPTEESDLPFNKSIYYGGAGTLWALSELSSRLQRPLPFDAVRLVAKIEQDYLDKPYTEVVAPSFFLGESGILLLSEKLSPSKKTRERLRACIHNNSKNPVNEALWGSPGTMLVALRLKEIELYCESAEHLLGQWYLRTEDNLWAWTQDLYGKMSHYLGAAHGFFGNVYALLEGMIYLPEFQRQQVLDRVVQTTLGTALKEDGLVNWPPSFGASDTRVPLVQWCHGAPGVIISLRSFPKNYSLELEKVLLEAGELIWKAGPLETIALCHGTDSNGYAFLRLFERTQDVKWLERARKFAMHALEQRNGRYTLWTGEAGLALFLLDCIDERVDFPTLDYF